jgi:hypothetical protein
MATYRSSIPASTVRFTEFRSLPSRDAQILVTGDGRSPGRYRKNETERPLASVHFADARAGWAVGRRDDPATRDGGTT